MTRQFNRQLTAWFTASVLSVSAPAVSLPALSGLALGIFAADVHAATPLRGELADTYTQPVTVSLGAEPNGGFDPIYGWGRYNNPLIQSALLRRDSTFNLEGDLAKSWTLSDDRKAWAVTLKPGIRFSDGTSLTAKDVAFTFNTAKQKASVYDLADLSHVQVVDDQTVVFHLKEPDIAFLDNLVTLAIVPQHTYSKGYAQHPVGSGPYQMVRWDKGQALLLKANPYYYGHKPQIKNLVVVFSGEDSRFSQLLAGQLDLAAIAPRYAKSLPDGIKLWSIKSVDNRGVSWPMVPFNGKNIGNNITSDKAIREAVNLVIDRQALVTNLLDGHARPAYSIADGLPWSVTPALSGTSRTQRFDQASNILDNAGWKLVDGVREKNGVKAEMTLYYKSGDSIREQLALTFAQMVKPLGIIIQTRGDSWENISKVMHKSPVLFGFGALSPEEMRFTYHSKFRGVDFYNAGYYANANVDKELDEAQRSASWNSALPHYRHAQKIIYNDMPWTWLVNLQHLYAGNPCLDIGHPGVEPHGHGWPVTNNITDWKWVCPVKP